MAVPRLVLLMGAPMIISMVLQALYNVVDTMFVINMSEKGSLGNLALSAAFPVQIFMIAIGVGTGVGLNAMLSKNLGEKNYQLANKVAGNGIFLGLCFYVLFLLFGLFFARLYMSLMSQNEEVIMMGSSYLQICCCISIGSLGYAVAERFLMATGKTWFSMISQISGALVNILLDYVFIYPCQMGIEGAAYATVIGQIVSLLMALFFHYFFNKEINGNPKYILPSWRVIKNVYRIGFPAFLMQALLSFMMFGVLLIIQTIPDMGVVELLTGTYGIYYKMMQIALFSAFGVSNALISIVSFNYGMGDEKRVKEAAKWGIIFTLSVMIIITLLYQILAGPISSLFALTAGNENTDNKALIDLCSYALHIASIGYLFMGFSVAIQGVLQGLGKVFSPVIISALRLIILVLPISFLLTRTGVPLHSFWWTFVISEVITAIISFFYLKVGLKKSFTIKKEII